MQDWIAETVGDMHVHKITQLALAEKLGIRNEYLNMILCGKRQPKGAREKIRCALDEMIREKQAQTS